MITIESVGTKGNAWRVFHEGRATLVRTGSQRRFIVVRIDTSPVNARYVTILKRSDHIDTAHRDWQKRSRIDSIVIVIDTKLGEIVYA